MLFDIVPSTRVSPRTRTVPRTRSRTKHVSHNNRVASIIPRLSRNSSQNLDRPNT